DLTGETFALKDPSPPVPYSSCSCLIRCNDGAIFTKENVTCHQDEKLYTSANGEEMWSGKAFLTGYDECDADGGLYGGAPTKDSDNYYVSDGVTCWTIVTPLRDPNPPCPEGQEIIGYYIDASGAAVAVCGPAPKRAPLVKPSGE